MKIPYDSSPHPGSTWQAFSDETYACDCHRWVEEPNRRPTMSAVRRVLGTVREKYDSDWHGVTVVSRQETDEQDTLAMRLLKKKGNGAF
jgi:hypothetical protein